MKEILLCGSEQDSKLPSLILKTLQPTTGVPNKIKRWCLFELRKAIFICSEHLCWADLSVSLAPSLLWVSAHPAALVTAGARTELLPLHTRPGSCRQWGGSWSARPGWRGRAGWSRWRKVWRFSALSAWQCPAPCPQTEPQPQWSTWWWSRAPPAAAGLPPSCYCQRNIKIQLITLLDDF